MECGLVILFIECMLLITFLESVVGIVLIGIILAGTAGLLFLWFVFKLRRKMKRLSSADAHVAPSRSRSDGAFRVALLCGLLCGMLCTYTPRATHHDPFLPPWIPFLPPWITCAYWGTIATRN